MVNQRTIPAMSHQHVPATLQFLRSAIAGGITAVFEFAAYVLIAWLSPISPILAASLSLGAGIVVNFLLSRHWVFAPTGKKLRREIIQFAGIAAIDLVGEWLTFTGLYIVMNNGIVAKLATMLLWFIINFALKQRVFREEAVAAVLPDVLKPYRHAPLGVQLHIAFRWLSCPLEVLAKRLPTQGRILEIGCGHASLLLYQARRHPALELLGTDIDERRLAVASAVARSNQLSHVTFLIAGSTAQLPDACWDAIIIADVLYLMSEEEQHRLLDWVIEHLNPHGRLYLKTMALSPAWKVLWNRFQETIAIRLLHWTRGRTTFSFPDPARLSRLLTQKGLRVRSESLDYGYIHPHYLLIAQHD